MRSLDYFSLSLYSVLYTIYSSPDYIPVRHRVPPHAIVDVPTKVSFFQAIPIAETCSSPIEHIRQYRPREKRIHAFQVFGRCASVPPPRGTHKVRTKTYVIFVCDIPAHQTLPVPHGFQVSSSIRSKRLRKRIRIVYGLARDAMSVKCFSLQRDNSTDAHLAAARHGEFRNSR
jgi:hypothetical protein